jgi:hypothetical protein
MSLFNLLNRLVQTGQLTVIDASGKRRRFGAVTSVDMMCDGESRA